ncbi:unannotated protein [freshwater metagenome]|uniref:Unannotated protein n=1 Tax=freshwater metagenome TaxID=449393 RepID=A0A6J7HA75_9ZZZZ|nr:NUDIX domain-containing protein [Actinomycetota bacterium]
MDADDLATGEELSTAGEVTDARQAATIILLRGAAAGLEILLVRRTPQARFMGGYWVFPGGAVDAHEGDGDQAHRAAAVRELEEEAGISGIAPAQLVKYSRWITPRQIRIRYDTHFFLAPFPGGQEPVVDGEEIVGWRWIAPGAALEEHARGELDLVYPTIRHLQQLAAFTSADELLAHAAGLEVLPVEPHVVMEGEVARVLLPGEAGYPAPAA